MTQSSSTVVARPANVTKNPFTQIVRPPKRPIEESEGENFRWGNVRQPGKRSRIGESSMCWDLWPYSWFCLSTRGTWKTAPWI